jgi:vacuolar-type H+-ATPase subunit H
LKNFEEDVGKIMMQDISQNPRKSLVKAMRDAAGQMQKLLDTYKEEGKKEADTIHEEKKLENLPPGDRASKDKTRTGPAKVVESEEDKPQTLSDYVQMRRNVSQKRKTEVGYQYRK